RARDMKDTPDVAIGFEQANDVRIVRSNQQVHVVAETRTDADQRRDAQDVADAPRSRDERAAAAHATASSPAGCINRSMAADGCRCQRCPRVSFRLVFPAWTVPTKNVLSSSARIRFGTLAQTNRLSSPTAIAGNGFRRQKAFVYASV